ncbi:hypothetical protein QPK87_19870 [Kamptonema cortianum]|nr:hypothetical protein [Geitlerinema splendidum]MDK3158816.1 hypothetical protein [Kamptonema cortianum]
MSAITFVTVKERPSHEKSCPIRTRRNVLDEPIAVSKVKENRRPLGLEFFASQALLFAVIFVVSYGFSLLMGNSVMEYARRSKIRSMETAKVARDDTAVIRGRLDRLAATAEVRDWATARGFVASHSLDGGSVNVQATLD